ncbi:MAG: hypothetical protein K2X81_01655 [Candidatus Obscuribacterales bacterium]|nr:hypothetical protein [Candidatus Obscuribacterales bacterium]
MDIVGIILIGLGALAMAVSGVWLIVVAFQKSIVWGLCYLFVPFAGLAFICMNWDRASKPFLLNLLALVVCGAGVFMSPSIRESITNPPSATSDSAPSSTAAPASAPAAVPGN